MMSLDCDSPAVGRSYTGCGGGNRCVRIGGTKHGWAGEVGQLEQDGSTS